TLEDARRAEGELARSLDDNDGRLSAAADGLQRVETERRDARLEAETLRSHLDELTARIEREQGRISEREHALPALEAAEAETVESGRRMGEARTQLDERAAEVGAMRTDLEVRTAAIDERRQFVSRRLTE